MKLNSPGPGVLLLVVLVLSSCRSDNEPQDSNVLLIEAAAASSEVSMSILPNQLGRFAMDNKFIGIVPIRLTEDYSEVSYYIIDNPTFDFDSFTMETIKRLGLSPTKTIKSLDTLSEELDLVGLPFGSFTVASKVTSEKKGGKLTVKHETTTVVCTCPCSVEVGGVTTSCS